MTAITAFLMTTATTTYSILHNPAICITHCGAHQLTHVIHIQWSSILAASGLMVIASIVCIVDVTFNMNRRIYFQLHYKLQAMG